MSSPVSTPYPVDPAQRYRGFSRSWTTFQPVLERTERTSTTSAAVGKRGVVSSRSTMRLTSPEAHSMSSAVTSRNSFNPFSHTGPLSIIQAL